jgi:two-component system chemotaxis sensor kinase CheA
LSSAEQEANREFLSEFLEDYFAECDEHLTVARRNLLALDQFVGQPSIDHSTLDELLRCFHSLKGISGMVGVRDAEHLAHQIESYLRALREGQSSLSPEGIDTLIAAVKAFEQIVAERRRGTAAAELAPVLSRLSVMVETSAPVSGSPSPMTPSKVQELK